LEAEGNYTPSATLHHAIAGWLCFWLSYPETKNTMTHLHSDDEEQSRSSHDARLNTLLSALSHSPQTGQSRIRLIAIGTPDDLIQLIHRLHRCGLEVPQWSTPQPIPDSNEVVRVYIQNSGRSSDRL
jgi:hypothetical protein